MSVIIRLQKLPLTANASDVRSFFRGLSIPDGGVHIVGGELGDAFIAFSTDEDARQAMALNGGRINGEPIMLLLSSRAEMQKVIDQARKAALSYMQMSRVVPTVAAASGTGLMPTLPKVATLPEPIIPPQPVGMLDAIATVAATLQRFNNPPPTLNTGAMQQKPQPPVISLSGFLANAVRHPVATSSLPTTAPAGVPSGGSMATQSSAYGSMLSQGSSFNEIPGLSVGNPVDTSPSLSVSNLSGWLSAWNGQQQSKAPSTSLNGGIDTSFLANSVTPVNLNGQQKDANSQNSWKFLKKERRSRSTSRERGYKRSGRSRSSSRDRDLKRDRRSRSSSRGRSYKRNGRNSRSSSRDRGSRSWSRDSSREYNRRYRNSRSRSPSRDRFGRTRHRSRSRSPRNHRNSRDRSIEPSGNPYDRDTRGGQSRGWSNSNFGGRTGGGSSQQTSQWNSMDKGFPGNSKPMDAAGGMPRHVEPIFGLHTQGIAQTGGMHFFPSRSGKISPLPTSNGAFSSGADGGGGGPFRSTSPLPESVYSIGFNNGGTTNDYAIKLSNLDSLTGYGEIRRFFKSMVISNQGIKMINDQNGRRTGVAYVQFLHKDSKRRALQRNGAMLRLMRLRIESISDQEFEQAIDSYQPGMDLKEYRLQQLQQQQKQQQSTQSSSGASGAGSSWNSHGKESPDDENDQSGGRKQQKSAEYQPTSTLMVWNLPSFSTEQDIMKMFSDFTVVEVLIVKNHLIPKQLDGYVRFHRQQDAKDAWLQVHRHYIGNKKVSVRMCPEIDYAVAKNEYENPGVASPNSAAGPKDSDDGVTNKSEDQPPRGAESGSTVESGAGDRDNSNQNNGDTSGAGEAGSQQSLGGNERREEGGGNGTGNGNGRRTGGGARKRRWDTEKNWDEEEGNPRVAIKAVDNAPQQRQTDSDAGAGSDTNSSWVDRNQRTNSGDERESSQTGDYYGNGNGQNNNMGDRRRQQRGSSGGRFSSGNSVDNSDMFQRTTCLLLRNVDFQVFEEDVFQFFAQDGFQAKNVLLVHNERGKRTGECLVEFDSPSEAAHAESKSSQNLGRRKVFASHLDRGQVAEMMKRFDAISMGLRENPEDSQGVGCGPYRTSTVGLLNLAYKTTEEDVQNFFREFDLPLENIRRRFLDNGQATGEAMVRFANHIDAEKALNEYQNRKLFGRNVRIRLINDD
ncbi:hypothetical protein ZHAS_00016724 [Anopheles sinensis]|uniref:RRM domain-containing protein n=1 Tax=Anopheles sinensis TaxID=74873 RepID=A0A084WES7_ANOSI|nr:hypothetical protein ZHAS_00016724 [Anopheles sinensis]